MNFVFTGILEKLTRHGAEQMATDFGHSVSDTVRPSTDYVVAGIRPGSKLKKAKDYSVKVITEDEFMKLMGSQVRFSKPERTAVQVPAAPFLPETIPGKYFLIGEIDWQYNDEYYHRGYDSKDSICPTKLFRRRSVAVQEMAKLNQKKFENTELEHYSEEGIGRFFKGRNWDYFRELFYQYTGNNLPEDPDNIEYDDGTSDLISSKLAKIPLERFINIMRFMDFGFYELHEVAIGD